jgi:nucleoside deoxyribosyltransferase
MKLYTAGPFFNDEQVEVMEQIEACAGRCGYQIFSPRNECYCPPGASLEQRKLSFLMNCTGIMSSDFVLARIDDFDPGTIWEVGFAYGLRAGSDGLPLMERPKVYAFTTVPSRGLNLMLAQSVDGFLKGLPSVYKFLKEMMFERTDKEAQAWKENII